MARVPRIAGSALQRIASLEPFPQPAVIALRYPVVLMHGFGMLAGIRRKGHLHDEAMSLRLSGIKAYAPNVAPYDTVPVRATMWRERIGRILAETGAERVNLIAHSMGGLDARYLISRLEAASEIATLTTISSPHHGSPIAEFLLDQPGRFQSVVNDLANWMGTTVLKDATADFLTTVQELTHQFCCETFNTAMQDHPDVRYWSYAGAAGKGTSIPINPILRLFNTIIYRKEGINDGFVSVDSARWGTFLGTIDADHTRQIGLNLALGGSFESRTFYRNVCRFLADEGY